MKRVLQQLDHAAKAVITFFGVGLTGVGATLLDGTLTLKKAIAILGAAAIASALAWAKRNGPKPTA